MNILFNALPVADLCHGLRKNNVTSMLDIQRNTHTASLLYTVMSPAVRLRARCPDRVSSTGPNVQRSPALNEEVQFITDVDMNESVKQGENLETSDCHVPFNASTRRCSSARSPL